MGKYLSRPSAYSDMDTTTLKHARSHERNNANRFRYVEERRFHNEKKLPISAPKRSNRD
jgi:hypothetical protein